MARLTLAVALGAFASFAGFLFGYDTGYISGCKEMPAFIKVYGDPQPDGSYVLSSSTNSLITSILSVGTCIGALCGSFAGDTLGRRLGIVFYICLFFIGVALQTGCHTLAGFAIGRVFAGLGVGGTSCLVPIYQAECCPPEIRGAVVSAYQFFITVGLLVAACVVDGTKNMDSAAAYQIPIGIQFIWGVIIVGGMLLLPESPRWLLMKSKMDKGKLAIARLLSEDIESPRVHTQYSEILANLEHERKTDGSSWAACFRQGEGKCLQRVTTGMALQALQQLTGINFIFYYGTSFFQNSGISNPFLITIATNVVNAGTTPIGMWASDRIGRRPLMIIGAVGMAIAQLIVAITGTVISVSDEAGQKVLVAFVCIFIAFFATTWATLAWVITSELYPYEVRAKGMSLSTASQWLFNFGIGYATPYLVDSGPGNAGLGAKVFFIWGGCCVIATVFAYFTIPETKELSLEQVDLLMRNSSVRKSAAYRRRILAEDLHDEGAEVTHRAVPAGSAMETKRGTVPESWNESTEGQTA